MNNTPRIICVRCVHYVVTWIPATPHGCRQYEIRTHLMPSIVVYMASGKPCQAYTPKR
ncbi:MAG: uracil-DNA glycosylase [Paenibacillaceae bacterium]|nr:uracil-DNA glycosylase [Paenibacillaceae bacterium]